MTKAPLALALAIAALTGCAKDAATDAEAATRAAALGVVAAYNRQDAAAAAAYDAPDYVGVYHGSANTIGPAADEAAMKTQMAQARVDWQLGKDQVTVSRGGDIGIFEAPYTFVVNIPGAPAATERGTWIAIFKRQADGKQALAVNRQRRSGDAFPSALNLCPPLRRLRHRADGDCRPLDRIPPTRKRRAGWTAERHHWRGMGGCRPLLDLV